MPDSARLRYQAFYCEENIFHLSQDPRYAAREPSAVFVTGTGGECMMWQQKQAPRPGAPLTWDYHVILLLRGPWEIWDFDTMLGAPVAASLYLRRSFRPDLDLPHAVAPLFRVVGAEAMKSTFASDRSHMRTLDGRYLRPPPPWPPIGAPGVEPNLPRFLSMTDPVAGEVMNLATLLARVTDE